MKYIFTLFLLTKVLLANALSFREVPLNKMIDKSDFIYLGRIIKVTETDSLLQKRLRNIIRSDDYKYGDPNCGYCNETAIFVIKKALKGKVVKDTISIPFHRSFMFLIPGFSENREYILFLNDLESFNLYIKTDLRFAAKSSHLREYESLIIEYLKLKTKLKKREWIIDLCVNPMLSGDGMRNFKYVNSMHFSDNEKYELTKGLLKMDFDNDRYLRLLECVQDFGRNDKLIEKCFDRLRSIKEQKVYEGLDLMIAINTMNPKPEYQKHIDRLSDGFNNKLSDSQKLKIIEEFVNEKS
ncbi:MAG: hypothetical protein ACPGSD_04945 [Flavobacteriales bacterium]